jgi:FimV-like protein
MMDFRFNRLITRIFGFAGFAGFAAISALSGTARAADFDSVTIESVVGQRVSGYVELSEVAAIDLSILDIQLASRSAYLENDVPYYSVHRDLLFQPTETANGSVQLDIRSKGVLREPKLNILLRITWSEGDLVKGLSLSVPFTQTALAADKTILTTPSDTLWQLAKRTRDGSQVSVAQQMLAIQRLNPGAFNKGNINGLKSGYLLRIPDFLDAVTVDKPSALDAVEGQHSQWLLVKRNGQRSGARGFEKTVPAEVELGADLPPAGRQGEVRIFQPESSIEASFAESDLDTFGASFEESALIDDSDSPLPVGVEFQGADSSEEDALDIAAPVNIDESVNEQIDQMVAEENQSSYSAQLVWLIAGGILGILIIVMLLRRQMAARKKNLEETWVADSEGNFDSEKGSESEAENESATRDDDDLESSSKNDLENGPEESQLDDLGVEPAVNQDEINTERGANEESQGASAMIEPSISAPEQSDQSEQETSNAGENAAVEPETDATFLEILDANEQPLGETSNTEAYTTRLKLAEAYLEMGDERGAREMLDEVVAEGDDAQKALAKSILERIDDGLDDSKDT